jgi:ankyrin repeat protein
MERFAIHHAVMKADIDAVSELIATGINLDELDELGHSPLHWAVFGGYYDIAKLLLTAGANPNVISEDGVSPKWRANDFGLLNIETLLTSYGGKILTNENYDERSFSIFNTAIGVKIPKQES